MYRLETDDLGRLQGSPREVSRWQKAQQLLLAGLNGQALGVYRDLAGRFPGVAQLWFERGMAAIGDLEFEEAHESLQKMIELAPKNVELLVLAGQQYHRLRQLERARECFELAVAADPHSVHAQLSLAAWFERERRMDEAWRCVETCLREHPRDAHALYYRAFLLHRGGENRAAEQELRQLLVRDKWPDAQLRCNAKHLLGVVMDALERYPEAMRWLCEGKAELRRIVNTSAMERQYDRLADERRQLLASLTPEMIQNWRREYTGAPGGQKLVFLGGHPRSGTTLIEQVLGAHPHVLAFDEPDGFVQEIQGGIVPATQSVTLANLNALSPGRRAAMRERYLKSVLREVGNDADAEVIVDKNPSPTASLPLWLRLFPDVKVIIPLRDPRDVVISCFFQNLTVTPGNVNFLSLDRTVRHYADLMDVWLRMRELGGFDWIETKYEDVVGDLESEGKRLTQFMDLDWDPDQAQFHEKARKKFVFAPTYHEVTKPVYTRAIGRWERYAEALAPFQNLLERYCREFGYA